MTTIARTRIARISVGRQRAGAAEFQRAADGARQAGDDAGEDDQRNAVADAARGDLLAEPHQEHGAADQRDDGRDAEEQAGIGDDAVAAFETDGDAVGLHDRQQHRAVAGVLVDDLAALLAFLLQRFERRNDRRHELHDDGGGDVGHDAEREDRHALDGAAGKHVEHAEHAAGLLLEGLGEGVGIDAGKRDVGAEAVDEQRAEREPDALLEILGLGEGCEIQIGCKLFSSRCHEVFSASSRWKALPGGASRRSHEIGVGRQTCKRRPWQRPPLRSKRYSASASAALASHDLDRTAGLLDLLDRSLGGAGDVEGQLRRQFAVGEQAHAVLGAADDAGLDQRLGVTVSFASSFLASIAVWMRPSETTLKLLAKMLLKPRLGRRR